MCTKMVVGWLFCFTEHKYEKHVACTVFFSVLYNLIISNLVTDLGPELIHYSGDSFFF